MDTAPFCREECNLAVAEWTRITGLDTSSPQWGEVLAVLDDAELLEADRTDWLFDDDEDTVERPDVRALRLAIVAGAAYWRTTKWSASVLPTSTAIVAAFLTEMVFDGLARMPFGRAVDRVVDAVGRSVIQVADSPSDALAWRVYLATEKDRAATVTTMRGEIGGILGIVVADDTMARKVFEHLVDDDGRRVALLPLAYGGWVVYHPATRPA